MELRDKTLSGFRLHMVHLYVRGMMFGAFLQGMIGMNIDVISTIVEVIPEYMAIFFSCII